MIKREELEKKEKMKSAVWDYFYFCPRLNKDVCILCWPEGASEVDERVLTIRKNNSTDSLRNHLMSKHGIETSKKRLRTSPQISKFFVSSGDKLQLDVALFRWLTQTHRPYSFVNDPLFKALCHAFHPGYKPAAVETLKNILNKEVGEIHSHLKNYLRDYMVAGALSADGWTSVGGRSYFGLLLHFIDHTGAPQTVLLDCLPKAKQDAESLAERVRTVLSSWDLNEFSSPLAERKIQFFTTDTTNTMPKMVELLKMYWVPCIAHVFNLVVKDALDVEDVKALLKKARKICTFYSKSSKNAEDLIHFQQQNDLKVLKVLIDVKTRWNSTLRMVDSIVKNKVFLFLFYF